MGKTLVIAEKPSVAADLARVLGKFEKKKDYFENDDFVISSAVGHLLELCLPAEMDKKRGKWKFESLPIIPDQFELKPIEKSESRYKVIKRLLSRKDVDRVINACDAGREGELIFHYIIQALKNKKPSQRLWLQSMTPDAIREGFSKLRDGEEMRPLADAAVCRSESDWLVGINGTRAFTAFNSKNGGFQLTTVGRVQTPTLTILLEREEKIRDFKPTSYWEVEGTFAAAAGSYTGRWIDEGFKKSIEPVPGIEATDRKAERIWDRAKAEAIQAACQGKSGEVTEERKPTTQASPLLYDLTSLQREANSRFGFSARRTLQLAQALYERHKAITYPRTDSRYLPDDYLGNVRGVLGKLSESSLGPHAKRVLEKGWLKPTKRVFNQAKVSDHFAIIPTSQLPKKLDEPAQKLYDMISQRLVAIFHPAAVFEVTTRITRVEGHPFKTEGKVLKEPGWMAVYGKTAAPTGSNGKSDALIVPVDEGETVETSSVDIKDTETRPPARFSEATLLSAMEGAGKLVDDEELREAMAEKGLGTPATRAAIIENLISEKYVTREGRELIPSAKAFALLDLLKALDVPMLSSPELTGEWEYKLKQIELGKLSRSDFMREIEDLTRTVVERAKTFDENTAATKPFDAFDPWSGEQLIETLRDYRSPDGELVIRKAIAGRIMEHDEIRELLEKRMIGPLTGFRSRMGRPFAAAVQLGDDKKVELVWDNPNSGPPQFDAEKDEPVGTCPSCAARIFETPTSYPCEKSVGENASCKFRIGKVILEQEIPKEQVIKILETGASDVMDKFRSQRTRRFFKARLIVKDGMTKFDFPERPAKKAAKKAPAKKAVKKKAVKKKAAKKKTAG